MRLFDDSILLSSFRSADWSPVPWYMRWRGSKRRMVFETYWIEECDHLYCFWEYAR